MYSLLDTHQHLIYRDQASYSWTKDIPPLAEDNFTLEDYKNLTQNLNVAGTLFMESGVDDNDYQKETRFIQTLTDSLENNMIGLIASIRPEADKEFDLWLNESIEMGVVGYRRILHVMPNELSQSETFRNIRDV